VASSTKMANGLFELSVGALGRRTVGLPHGMTARRGNDEVDIIRRREADDFLPVRFVGIERNKVSKFMRGKIFAHAVNDHGADQRRRVLEGHRPMKPDSTLLKPDILILQRHLGPIRTRFVDSPNVST